MKTTLVLAVADNGVIGRDGGLPWRLSSDMKRFKATTMGRPLIMGRKTWESLPRRPLPGRANIVVSRNPRYVAEGADVVTSLDDALRLAAVRGRCAGTPDEACVIGGAQLFAEAIGNADRLDVTHVLAEVEGDVALPPIDPGIWSVVSAKDIPAGEGDEFPTRHCVYERRQNVR